MNSTITSKKLAYLNWHSVREKIHQTKQEKNRVESELGLLDQVDSKERLDLIQARNSLAMTIELLKAASQEAKERYIILKDGSQKC